jgi:hypothetical protein
MKSISISKALLTLLLSISLIATGCSARWISVALADLPVLTQMALNLAALVSTLQSGKQLSPAEAAAIQNISAEANKDLTLLQSLYNAYKANPSPDTLLKIENLIQEVNQNLPGLLQAAHISNPALSARITAAVNLMVTTVSSFGALLPQSSTPPKAVRANVARQNGSVAGNAALANTIPSPKDLKRYWNLQVCAPSGNTEVDVALSERVLK